MDFNLLDCYTLFNIHPLSVEYFDAFGFDSVMANHTCCDLLRNEHFTFLNDFGVPYYDAFDALDFHITTARVMLAIHDFDNLAASNHCFDNLHNANLVA